MDSINSRLDLSDRQRFSAFLDLCWKLANERPSLLQENPPYLLRWPEKFDKFHLSRLSLSLSREATGCECDLSDGDRTPAKRLGGQKVGVRAESSPQKFTGQGHGKLRKTSVGIVWGVGDSTGESWVQFPGKFGDKPTGEQD